MPIKKYIVALICMLLIAMPSIRFVDASEDKAVEQAKAETPQGSTEEAEKEYKLIEETKDYLTSPKEAFLYYCSPCHGVEANGKGIYFTIDLKPSPADLTNIEKMAALTDDYLLNFITKGSAAMQKSDLCPPWGATLEADLIKGIVTYLRTLTIQKSKEEGEASVVEADAAKVAVEEKEKGTPQAVIWSVLVFLCAFFAIGAVREWKKLAEEGTSKKK